MKKHCLVILLITIAYPALSQHTPFVQKEFVIGAYVPPPLHTDVMLTCADYDGDNIFDLSTRTNSGGKAGEWRIDYSTTPITRFAQANTWDDTFTGYFGNGFPVPGKYRTRDNKAEISLLTYDMEWLIDYSDNGFTGWEDMIQLDPVIGSVTHAVPADYDGDGLLDLAVKTDDGYWYIDYSNNGFLGWDASYSGLGGNEAIPVPADYNNDGYADMSVKLNDGTWKIWLTASAPGFSSTATVFDFSAKNISDALPFPADHNRDGQADLMLWNPVDGTLYYYHLTSGNITGGTISNWSSTKTGFAAGEYFTPFVAEFEGDGKADFMFYNNQNGVFLIDFSDSTFESDGWNYVSDIGKGGNSFLMNYSEPMDLVNAALMKDAGFNLVLSDIYLNQSSAETEYYLKVLEEAGVKIIPRVRKSDETYSQQDVTDLVAFLNGLNPLHKQTIYAIDPGDEPYCGTQLTDMRTWIDEFRSPTIGQPTGLPLFTNYLPVYGQFEYPYCSYQSYLDDFITPASNSSDIVSFDHYPFRSPDFYENYFMNLRLIKEKAKQHKKPFWSVIASTAESNIVPLTFEQLQFLAYAPLAYGAKGITYFDYKRSIHQDVNLYNSIGEVNRYIKNVVAPVVMRSENIASLHKSNDPVNTLVPLSYGEMVTQAYDAGSSLAKDITGDEVMVGVFRDKINTNEQQTEFLVGFYHLLVINKSTTASSGSITVHLNGNFDNRIWIAPSLSQYTANNVASFPSSPLAPSFDPGTGMTDIVISNLLPGEARLIKVQAICQAAPARYDNDVITDISVKDQLGSWYIDYSGNGFGEWDEVITNCGGLSAHPVPADYDGDGKADLSVKSDWESWLIDYSSVTAPGALKPLGEWDVVLTGYGDAQAVPVPGYFNNDAFADLGVKAHWGSWLIDYRSSGFYNGWDWGAGSYGGSDAHPIARDFNGDGISDLSVKTDYGSWLIDVSPTFGSWDFTFTHAGNSSYVHAPADYNGDGICDLAVKNAQGVWTIDLAVNGGTNLGFGTWDITLTGRGNAGFHPVPADYGGDGKADVSVITDDGRWLIDYSINGYNGWETLLLNPNPLTGVGLGRTATMPIKNKETKISTDTEFQILAIYDLNGKLIKQVNTKGRLSDVQKTNNLPKDIYIIIYTDEGKLKTYKLGVR